MKETDADASGKGWPDAVIALCRGDKDNLAPSPMFVVAAGILILFFMLGIALIMWVDRAYPQSQDNRPDRAGINIQFGVQTKPTTP